MEIEKQILEMLAKINDKMDKGFSEVKTQIAEVNKRLDGVENRLDNNGRKLDGICGQFEVMSDNIID